MDYVNVWKHIPWMPWSFVKTRFPLLEMSTRFSINTTISRVQWISLGFVQQSTTNKKEGENDPNKNLISCACTCSYTLLIRY